MRLHGRSGGRTLRHVRVNHDGEGRGTATINLSIVQDHSGRQWRGPEPEGVRA